MTLIDLYGMQHAEGLAADEARAFLRQAHWFGFNTESDPKTGEALPQALSGFLAKLTQTDTCSITHDRLWRITEHTRPSVERLLRSLSESPRREHALMPVHAVRELDANSFIKLSNRPGRNIREKLAGKPYMQAVRRYQSVNLPENRLLKAFVIHLAELLELRRDCLNEEEDELVARIHFWLRGDEAQAIARWHNLPPNNTLLSHRDYRRIWDAWRWIQSLDDDIAHDLANFESRAETMRKWQAHGEDYLAGGQLFAEQPVLFRYNTFSIRPWSAPIQVRKVERKVTRSRDVTEILEPACVDLVNPRPRYATASQPYGALPDTYLWQQWHDGKETFDFGLFRSDAAFLHADATSVAMSDLFFDGKQTNDLMHRAARSFASRLRESFKNESLVWLVPDSVNDFEIEILRRHLNSHFSRAEPLPRSVAAVFEQVDHSGIKREGFTVVVVDSIGGCDCATKLIAKFDPELQKRLPETKGFYWERCPPVTLLDSDQRTMPLAEPQLFDLLTLDSNGNWHDPEPRKNQQPISPTALKEDPRIGSFNSLIELKKSPVAGGARLHSLQLQAGDIPLWRDQIPELAIKGYIGGFYRRFYLVTKGTTIKPIRGLAIQIPITEWFTLPAEKNFYQFPLFQGENAAELSFSARLDSPAFPLKSNTECELILTFQYGEDEPYGLMLVPLDKSFPPVRATWQRTEEETVTNAGWPVYPKPFSWADLRRMQKPDSMETRDLLEWVVSAIDRIDRDLVIRPRPRIIGTLTRDWGMDRKGYHIARAKCGMTNDVFIHELSFVEGFTYSSFERESQLSFELHEDRDGRFSGRRVARSDYTESGGLRQLDECGVGEIVNYIHKGIYFPMIKIWSDGRSIEDLECPEEFVNAISERLDLLAELICAEQLPHVIRRELLFLLACTHQDTRKECVEWIVEQIGSNNLVDPQAIGFALGDLSKAWQRYLFGLLTKETLYFTINVCAFAVWRAPQFVEQLRIEEISLLLDCVSERLARLQAQQGEDGTLYISLLPLELLLGLLRTRASDDPEIRTLLHPHKKITKQLAEQIDRIEEIIANSNIRLFSRVQIDVPKPEGVRTPDLLYALRLYLTGDDGANAIHITSVSDSDEG
jgi:hypothetical protein